MPFSMDKPDDLPENVQKLSSDQQKQWVRVFNDTHSKCMEGDDTSGCEATAFAQANGAVKDKDQKAGRRNNKTDKLDIQAIHDKAAHLGAECKKAGYPKEMKAGEMHQALAELYDLPYNAKALELERQQYQVRQAWYTKYQPPKQPPPYNYHDEISHEPMEYYCKAVFPDFIVVESMESGHLYKYDYFIDSMGQVHFEDPVRVEIQYTEVESSKDAKTVGTIVWSCGVRGHEHVTPKEAHDCINQTTLNTPYVRTEFVKSVYSNNSLKAVSKTEDELIVANYMVMFGGRDLEGIATPRVNPDGTKGEYFTKATEFKSDYTETGQLLIDWEHRTRPDGVGPDDEDIFGYVDWKTAIVDETGLFVNRVLNRRNRYVKMLEGLIDAGMLGSSTEAVQKGVEKGTDGEIKTWPLKRDSFSVTPMDPRMMSENHLGVVKALRDHPDGAEIFEKFFNTEGAKAKAKALSLINQIGESYEA